MKKRLVSLLLIALLMMSTVSALAMGGMRGAYIYANDGKGVNMRPTPSTEMSPIAFIPYGTLVHINDYIDNEWVEIDYNGLHGFVMGRYLTYDPPPDPRPQPTYVPVPTYPPQPTYKPMPAPTQKPTKKPDDSGSASVKQIFDGFEFISYSVLVRPSPPGNYVHMRWAPTKAANPICHYHKDYELFVIAQNETWAQVVDPETGATGFMMRYYLTDFGVGSLGAGGS